MAARGPRPEWSECWSRASPSLLLLEASEGLGAPQPGLPAILGPVASCLMSYLPLSPEKHLSPILPTVQNIPAEAALPTEIFYVLSSSQNSQDTRGARRPSPLWWTRQGRPPLFHPLYPELPQPTSEGLKYPSFQEGHHGHHTQLCHSPSVWEGPSPSGIRPKLPTPQAVQSQGPGSCPVNMAWPSRSGMDFLLGK